eukprot:TRINITY_DN2747_c0_g1_i2.p1 TRINITY_DN2747_c0_g1~~TRINITY_DN2747_c0_g1_i2.p1  ORF type:complete len:387 (+),score=42.85 TRINITY_DN2747_c0_g1_i2:642-1802(+)
MQTGDQAFLSHVVRVGEMEASVNRTHNVFTRHPSRGIFGTVAGRSRSHVNTCFLSRLLTSHACRNMQSSLSLVSILATLVYLAESVVAQNCTLSADSEVSDVTWLTRAGWTVLTMQTGFAMLEAGSVRGKNATSIMLKNVCDAAFGAIAWYCVGYGVAFGTSASGTISGFTGTGNFFMLDLPASKWGFWIFEFAFAAAAATIVSGAVAERMKFLSYLFYTMFITGLVYPAVAHWLWDANGWLVAWKAFDFAGCAVVHMVGGTSALVGAIFVRPRTGRFRMEGGKRIANPLPIANPAHVVLGLFILWWGWYAFNSGSTLGVGCGNHNLAAKVSMTTTMGAAGGLVFGVMMSHFLKGYADPNSVVNGCLAGLVAITYVLPYCGKLVSY